MRRNMNVVTLVWMAKTESGWKRFPVVTGRNGRVKKGAVLNEGKEVIYPDGYFQLRYYEDRKTKYRNVGVNATEAVNECDRLQLLSNAKASAMSAGVTVNEPTARKIIKTEAAKFAKAAEDRGAMEAAAVNRAAINEFQKANPKLTYVDEITSDSAIAFWRFLAKDKKADRTIYNAHMRLTGFLKFLDVDYKKWKLRAPRFEKKLPDIYTPEEIARILAASKREYNRVLISILAKTGLRDQELQHLCWTDISFTSRKLRVAGKQEYDWKIKDYEQRDIPLPSELLKLLTAWRKANPKKKLVLGTAHDKPNTKFLLALKSIAKNAKVSNATLHRFRRTYCTTLLRGGLDLRTVQLLMGHSDLASTMRYLTPATGDAVRNQIDEILK
jgi:integrase